jgi:hypothetical protein
MDTGNSIFKALESDTEVPTYLKTALVSEMDMIRNSMQIVTHFTEHFLTASTLVMAMLDDEEPNT